MVSMRPDQEQYYERYHAIREGFSGLRERRDGLVASVAAKLELNDFRPASLYLVRGRYEREELEKFVIITGSVADGKFFGFTTRKKIVGYILGDEHWVDDENHVLEHYGALREIDVPFRKSDGELAGLRRIRVNYYNAMVSDRGLVPGVYGDHGYLGDSPLMIEYLGEDKDPRWDGVMIYVNHLEELKSVMPVNEMEFPSDVDLDGVERVLSNILEIYSAVDQIVGNYPGQVVEYDFRIGMH